MKHTLEELSNVFYPHYFTSEQRRREEALELYSKGDFETIQKKYIHYFKTERVSLEIRVDDLDELISELNKVKYTIPFNAFRVKVDSVYDEDRQTSFNRVYYMKVAIEDENKCSSLAKCWARDAAWKMKHQSDGKDGKRAIELFNNLIK